MLDKRIKIRHIQCFVEIARARSLKLAAERLFLTQPAISKTLKELEEILGADLLERSRAGVTLTKAGEVFLHFAQTGIAALSQGFTSVDQVSKQGKTTLAVGVLPSVAASLMPDVATEFSKIAPDTILQIFDGPYRYLIDQLRSGALDIVWGRMGPVEAMQGLAFTHLYDEQVAFVVRPDHPALANPSVHQLLNWPVLYPTKSAAIRPSVDQLLLAHGISDLPNRIESVSGAFGRVYTRSSDAIWIISSGVVRHEISEGRLVKLPIDTATTKGPVGLMFRPSDANTLTMGLFDMAIRKIIHSK